MSAPDAPSVPPRRAGTLVVVLLAAVGAAAVVFWPAGKDAPTSRPRETASVPVSVPTAAAPTPSAPTPPAPAPPPTAPPSPPPGPAPAPAADTHAGQRAFTGEVPEAISLIPFDMARTIDRARERRWFDDDEAYRLSQAALARAQDYAARLESDRLHRAFDGAIRVVASDPDLARFPFDAMFVPPYVICAAREGKDSDPSQAVFDLPALREQRLREYAERATTRTRRMTELGRLLRQTYVEFLRRHGERANLHDLLEPFGGRPDLPISKRSFRDGCPLLVWITDEMPRRGPPVPFVADDGRLVVLGDDLDDVRSPPYVVEYASLQLLHWFRRQRNEWGGNRESEGFFDVGFPALWSAVDVSPDGALSWRPVGSWREFFATWREAKPRMPLFPLKDLVRFESPRDAFAYAANGGEFATGISVAVFREESTALLAFLRDGAQGTRREAYESFVAAMLDLPPPGASVPSTFEDRFGLRSAADWTALDAEFRAYVTEAAKNPPKEPEARRPVHRAESPAPEVFGVSAPRGGAPR